LFPQGKYLHSGGSLAFHEPLRNIDNLDEKQTIIQECSPYRIDILQLHVNGDENDSATELINVYYNAM
jgi:hypothetical protein